MCIGDVNMMSAISIFYKCFVMTYEVSFVHGGRYFFFFRMYLELITDPLISQRREVELNWKYR